MSSIRTEDFSTWPFGLPLFLKRWFQKLCNLFDFNVYLLFSCRLLLPTRDQVPCRIPMSSRYIQQPDWNTGRQRLSPLSRRLLLWPDSANRLQPRVLSRVRYLFVCLWGFHVEMTQTPIQRPGSGTQMGQQTKGKGSLIMQNSYCSLSVCSLISILAVLHPHVWMNESNSCEKN